MWRIFTVLAALAVALLPLQAAAAPDDRAGVGLAIPTQVVVVRQAQELQDLQGQLAAVTADRDQARAKVTDLQGQVDALQGQLAAMGAGVGSGPAALPASLPGVNHFPWGWCTWYVASRRWVPWFGNAITWLSGAAAYGYPEGRLPRPGAIMVTAESIWGHVAYVEAVNGDGSFLVSEMNYAGFGAVDRRTVVPGRVPVLGFIY